MFTVYKLQRRPGTWVAPGWEVSSPSLDKCLGVIAMPSTLYAVPTRMIMYTAIGLSQIRPGLRTLFRTPCTWTMTAVIQRPMGECMLLTVPAMLWFLPLLSTLSAAPFQALFMTGTETN